MLATFVVRAFGLPAAEAAFSDLSDLSDFSAFSACLMDLTCLEDFFAEGLACVVVPVLAAKAADGAAAVASAAQTASASVDETTRNALPIENSGRVM